MNGIMVPLLMLCMTGIVCGQQNNTSSPTSTAPFSGSVPIRAPGPMSPATIPAGQMQRQSGPFEIEIATYQIEGLKQGKTLDAPISPRDKVTNEVFPLSVVSGITLVHELNVDQEMAIVPLHGTNAGNGVLQFDLNDQDFVSLKTKRLSFNFSDRNRGQFSRVVVRYVPSIPETQVTPIAGPAPNTTPPQQPFTSPSAGRFAGNLDLPSPPSVYDNQPTRPFGAFPLNPTQPNPTQPNPIPSTSTWPITPISTGNPTSQLAPIRPATSPVSTDALAWEQSELLRKKQEQDQRAKTLDQFQDDLIDANKNLTQRERQYELQRYASRDSNSGFNDGVAPRPNRQAGPGGLNPSVQGMTTAAPASSNSAANPAQTSDAPLKNETEPVPSQGGSERIMFFMLLCSFGLNGYLAFISRGFYARYSELADELRETFTASL